MNNSDIIKRLLDVADVLVEQADELANHATPQSHEIHLAASLALLNIAAAIHREFDEYDIRECEGSA